MKKTKQDVCVWIHDDYYDFYDTSCGNSFTLEGSLKESGTMVNTVMVRLRR